MYKIRRANKEDLEALLALEQLCFEKPWSKAMLQTILETYEEAAVYQEFAFVLEGDDRVLAYIAWLLVMDEATLLSIAVHPDYRRLGLANRLLEASYEQLRQARVERLLLEVSENNKAAQALYLREGFQKDGERANYYGAGEAAWLMSRNLV